MSNWIESITQIRKINVDSKNLVYIGHDNSIDLVLKTDTTYFNATASTVITISFGKHIITGTKSNYSTGVIRWASGLNYSTGEIRLFPGMAAASIVPGIYDVPVITYTTGGSSNGIVWGTVNIKVMNSPEGTAT